MFQSLIGFKINWNFIEKVEEGFTKEFQSLIGFKINWNVYSMTGFGPKPTVSIPNRV